MRIVSVPFFLAYVARAHVIKSSAANDTVADNKLDNDLLDRVKRRSVQRADLNGATLAKPGGHAVPATPAFQRASVSRPLAHRPLPQSVDPRQWRTARFSRVHAAVDEKKANDIGSKVNAGAQSLAASAAVAAAAANAAVSMKKLEAPDTAKTYIVKDSARQGLVDEEGLPVVYDKDLIEAYWRKEDGALQKRWREFLGESVPFLTKTAALLVKGGADELKANDKDLARDARKSMEKLGPTYIKAGQMLSVRPDVLPQAALDELAVLQDSVKPFETKVAVETIETELGGPLGQFFSEISEEPVAAASLAQVYKAKTIKGETVAVKVQRPEVLSIVSKDLYVLRRAAEVYQSLMERFAPQQKTDYVALLNEWAIGFYTELDFTNEAANQMRLKSELLENGVKGVYVPEVYQDLSTRRLLVTEWLDGCKLSECPPDEIKEFIDAGQECFLTQLLSMGFFHSDPHPGNIMKLTNSTKGKIALIDFGLVASLQLEDMDQIVSSIIHLANKDYPSLVDDFISLGILPPDTDRPKVIPLMDKALSPYVKGGGAKKYEEELKRMYGMDGSAGGNVGGFQKMTQDALTVFNDIPFTIPPYFALIARAVVTLEGVALQGDPDYSLIMEAYPFVARKLLRDDRPEIQRSLQEALYGNRGNLSTARLSTLLNGALGVVAKSQGGVFVDFDSIPEDGVALEVAVKYLLSNSSRSLRNLLASELENVADLLLRQGLRKGFTALNSNIPRPPLIDSFLPKFESMPGPVLLPTASGQPVPALTTPQEIIDTLAPKLSREEELYALSVVDLVKCTVGDDIGVVLSGDVVLEPLAAVRLLLSVLSTGNAPAQDQLPPQVVELVKQVLTALNGGQVERSGTQESGSNRDEALKALGALDPSEREVLQYEVQDLLDRLRTKCLIRLAPMAGVEPPPVPEPRMESMEQREASTGRAAGEFRAGSSTLRTSGSQALGDSTEANLPDSREASRDALATLPVQGREASQPAMLAALGPRSNRFDYFTPCLLGLALGVLILVSVLGRTNLNTHKPKPELQESLMTA